MKMQDFMQKIKEKKLKRSDWLILVLAGILILIIAIRLVYKKKGEICIRSGAGIVADSVPEKEFEECCNKARAVVQAIAQAQEGLE